LRQVRPIVQSVELALSEHETQAKLRKAAYSPPTMKSRCVDFWPAMLRPLIDGPLSRQVTLADQQLDPNSPLYSVKTFEELGLYVSSPSTPDQVLNDLRRHQDLLKGIYAMGFSKPSKIQERALPLLLQNPCVSPHQVVQTPSLIMPLVGSPQNMIGQSQSGTGKTAAFVLTMLSRIDFTKNKTQVRSEPTLRR
jgi:ATP-dependent RNA helicase DDX19/DBP5